MLSAPELRRRATDVPEPDLVDQPGEVSARASEVACDGHRVVGDPEQREVGDRGAPDLRSVDEHAQRTSVEFAGDMRPRVELDRIVAPGEVGDAVMMRDDEADAPDGVDDERIPAA